MPTLGNCDALKELLPSLIEDHQKACKGNKAAARRLRKTLMEIRNLAHAARKEVLGKVMHAAPPKTLKTPAQPSAPRPKAGDPTLITGRFYVMEEDEDDDGDSFSSLK